MLVQVVISMCLGKKIIKKINIGSLSSQCRSANSGLKTCLTTKYIYNLHLCFFHVMPQSQKGRMKAKKDSRRLPHASQGLGKIPK